MCTVSISFYAVTWSDANGGGGVWIGAMNKNSTNFFNSSDAELQIEYLDGTVYSHLSGLTYNFDSKSPYFRLYPEYKFEDRNDPTTGLGGVLCEYALADVSVGRKRRKRGTKDYL